MPQKRPRLGRILRVRWRLLLRRLERISPLLLAWIPSWGTSLLFHGLAILLLALYLYVHSGGPATGTSDGTFSQQQLTEDLTSLFDSDHAGDPFTNAEVARAAVALGRGSRAEDRRHQPARDPELARFAPELAGPEGPPELGPSLGLDRRSRPELQRQGGEGCQLPAARRGHHRAVLGPRRGEQGQAASAAKGGRSIPRRRSRTGSTGSSATSAPTAPGA